MTVSVSDALNSRMSVRDFLPKPVPEALLREVLRVASRSPSGGNVQPWHIDIVSGARLDELRAIMQSTLAGVAAGTHQEAREYEIYPAALPSPYRDYRFKVGEDMYGRMGIPREDKAARLKWFARNYEFFGAPTALFCTVDRGMGPPQWADMGMFLQSVMLALREAGVDSCAQECWAVYPTTIRSFLGTPDHRMLFTGMAIGYRNPDHPVNALRTERADVDTFVRFQS